MEIVPNPSDKIVQLQSKESDSESEPPNGSFTKIKAQVAEKLHLAAKTLHGKTESSQIPREVANFGSQASSWLHNSADYIEETDTKKIKDDITKQVQRNPGKSLLVAAAAGLILGVIFRRK